MDYFNFKTKSIVKIFVGGAIACLFGVHSAIATETTEKPKVEGEDPLTFAGYDYHAYINASFSRGGYVAGAAFEIGRKSSIGVGLYGHLYKKDDSKNATGVDVYGVFVAPHLDHGGWDCYFMTGLAVQEISSTTKNETGFGPSFGVGVLYHIKEGLAMGMEKVDHYDWITSDFKGLTMSDLVFKVRISF
ncbi:MAG: hypothetical protein KDD61_04270 [Bdellovibrionales bacterium]|nr:hypothetical protein [Bdellovibrionales bacterium]